MAPAQSAQSFLHSLESARSTSKIRIGIHIGPNHRRSQTVNQFRLLFCQTLRATIPDQCQLPQRQLCVTILQHGWHKGLISWNEWSDADVASVTLLLDDLRNPQLIRELTNEHARRAISRKMGRSSVDLTDHMVSPWAGLAECVTGLQPADTSLDAIIELVADASDSYINLFGRLLGVWPFSDVRPLLRVSAPDPISLPALHLMAVASIITAGLPVSAEDLPVRVLQHMYSELMSISTPPTSPAWWNSISEQDRNLMRAVYALGPNSRFVFASVIWGGLRLRQIAAFASQGGARVDVIDVFYELQSAWQKILPIL